jgi:hypothetical protein
MRMPRSSTSGQGRPKGVPNKIPAAVKDMVMAALEKVGGIDYLAEQATKNPAAFMALLGKVLPMQLTGANDGPVMIITGVCRHGEGDEGDDAVPCLPAPSAH